MPKQKTPPIRGLEERNALVLKNYKLSHHMFKKMRHLECVKRLGEQDAAQAGFLALIRAAEKWDPAKSKFTTYACNAIYKSIMDACSDSCPTPFTKTAKRKGAYPKHPKPLPDCRDMLVEEVYLDYDPDWGEILDLRQACALLPQRWQWVLHEIFHNDLYCREVGVKVGLSHESIRKIKTRALTWLRAYLDGETTEPPTDNPFAEETAA